MFSWLKRKKGILASAVLIAVMLSLLGVRIADRDSPDLGQVQFGVGNEKIITLGYEALAAGSLDYTFDGVDDDVQLQAALDALPATGGRLVIVSAVQINLSNTVSRAIDNVIIEGAGDGTYFVNDGVTAIFDAGVQDGWRFSNFRTDAGGLDVATATNYRIDNVTIGTTFYPASTKTATFVVAASDSTTQSKAQADYVCDGTDDQVEIQAAIDALPAGGGVVKLLEGTFTNSDRILIDKAGVSLVGSGMFEDNYGSGGTVIDCSAVANHGIWVNHGTEDFCLLSNFTLHGKTGEYGVRVSGDDVTIDSVYIKSAQIAIGLNSGQSNFKLINSWIEGNVQGVDLESPGNAKILNCVLGDNTQWSVRIIGTHGPSYATIIAHNTIFSGMDGIQLRDCENVIIADNFFHGIGHGSANTYSAVNLASAVSKHVVITSNILRGGDNPKHFVDIEYGDYVTIVDNDIYEVVSEPIFIAANQNEHGRIFEKHSDLFMDVLAVSATHIRSNEDLSAATPITFTIDAQPDVPRTLSGHFDAHANITAYTIEITGVDAKGNTVTETKTDADGWDWETSNAFATITSIKMTERTGTGAGDTMDIGITDVLGLSNVIYETGDVYKIKKNNTNATVAGAQVDTDYDTYDMSVIGLANTDDFTVYYRSNLNIID